MPFTRVTLINNSGHTADAHVRLDPGQVPAHVMAPSGTTQVNPAPPPGPFTTISPSSTVDILGLPPGTVRPANALGGQPGDDIEEAVLYIGLDQFSPNPLPTFEFIVAKIVNGGNVRYETQPLV